LHGFAQAGAREDRLLGAAVRVVDHHLVDADRQAVEVEAAGVRHQRLQVVVGVDVAYRHGIARSGAAFQRGAGQVGESRGREQAERERGRGGLAIRMADHGRALRKAGASWRPSTASVVPKIADYNAGEGTPTARAW